MRFPLPVVVMFAMIGSTAAQAKDSLLQDLSAANEHAVQAWRSQDRAAFAGTFAPHALYVSSDGIFTVKDILDGLMTCTVGEVTVSNARVERVSETVAVMFQNSTRP